MKSSLPKAPVKPQEQEQEPELEPEFTVVSTRRSGPRNNALFHHLMETGNACIAVPIADGRILKVERPKIKRPVDHPKILIKLSLKLLLHNLFDFVSRDVLSQYNFIGELEYHWRFDPLYGSKDSHFAQDNLFWHSHLTLSRVVGTDESGQTIRFSIHTYIAEGNDTAEGEGRVCGVYIKEPNKAPSAADVTLTNKARDNAEEALKFIKQAEKHMAKEKAAFSKKFDIKLSEMSKLVYLESATEDSIERDLIEAREMHRVMNGYLENQEDKRFDHVLTFINRWKASRQKLPPQSPLSLPTQFPTSPRMDLDEERTRSRTLSNLSVSSGTSTTASSSLGPSPTKELIERDTLANLKERCQTLRRMTEEPFTNAEDAMRYHALRTQFEVDLNFTYINTRNEKITKVCLALEKAMSDQPSLYKIFANFALHLDVQAVHKLWEEVKNRVPYEFYAQFLYRITQFLLEDDEESKAIELCKFFFKRAKDYPTFVDDIPIYTIVVRQSNGKFIQISLLTNLILLQNKDLFKCLIDQCRTKDFVGYVQNGKIASLFQVACAFSEEPASDFFIATMLANNPTLEIPFPFAEGVDQQEEPDPTPTEDFTGEELATMNQKAELILKFLNNLPHKGSGIFAYTSAPYHDTEILQTLAKKASTLHLVLGFANFCFSYASYVLVYSSERYGFGIDRKQATRMTIAESHLAWSYKSGVNYIGCCMGNSNTEAYDRIEILFNETKARLFRATQDQIQELVTQVQSTLETYKQLGDYHLALVCTRAILFLCSYIEPSAENHRKIIDNFICAAELQKLEGEEDFMERQYKYALDVSTLSKFKAAFRADPELSRIKNIVDELEASKRSAAKHEPS